MMSLLALCEVEPYVHGEIKQPNKDNDPAGYENWKKNDNYAKHLVTQNVGDESIIHIQHGSTSHVVWKNLEAIYEDKSQETAVAIICNLWLHCPRVGLGRAKAIFAGPDPGPGPS